jgi:hypothetical protein
MLGIDAVSQKVWAVRLGRFLNVNQGREPGGYVAVVHRMFQLNIVEVNFNVSELETFANNSDTFDVIGISRDHQLAVVNVPGTRENIDAPASSGIA